MKPTFLTSLALVSIFQPMNMLFASAHPSAPASAPAKLELNTKANCYTPPDNGTGCSDDIPYTPAAEDPIRDMCKNDCNPYPGWIPHKNHWQCVIWPGQTKGTIHCVL
ncbi:hypothetical protein ACJQWK_06672 [Exserohilum turcicum]